MKSFQWSYITICELRNFASLFNSQEPLQVTQGKNIFTDCYSFAMGAKDFQSSNNMFRINSFLINMVTIKFCWFLNRYFTTHKNILQFQAVMHTKPMVPEVSSYWLTSVLPILDTTVCFPCTGGVFKLYIAIMRSKINWHYSGLRFRWLSSHFASQRLSLVSAISPNLA